MKYTPWRPSLQEVALLRKHRKRKGLSSSSPSSTVGLRGLINLGNTCFMSCIVQTLIHTPLLRDYFLSDRHLCLFDGGGGGGGGGGGTSNSSKKEDDGEKKCIVCEMSRLFQASRHSIFFMKYKKKCVIPGQHSIAVSFP